MQTLDGVQNNKKKIEVLFPNCITEKMDKNGHLVKAIDFDKLRQELSSELVEGREERFQFVWPDKKKAILLANSPINATLRPCREESVDFENTYQQPKLGFTRLIVLLSFIIFSPASIS